MKHSSLLSVCVMFLMALVFLVSCDNLVSVKSDKVIVSIIEPDYSLDPVDESGEKAINASVEGSSFKIKMNPTWTNPDGVSIYGDTGDEFIEIEDLNSIGYFAQGVWDYVVEAYYNGSKIYEYSGSVAINSYSRKITIDPHSLVVNENSSAVCNIKLSNFDFLMVNSLSFYNQEKEGGFKYTVGIKSLEDASVAIAEAVIPVTDEKDTVVISTNDGIVASVSKEGFSIGEITKSGAYAMCIYMYEWKDGTWKKTGGREVAFVSIPGAPITISGIEGSVDLYPADYVTPGGGTGGVIIDSGINSVITITSKVEGNAVENNTVTNGTTVTFTASVTQNGVPISDISNNIWMVNGDIQSGFDTNVFSYQFTENKTYTITYMFTDSTSYNTISKNEYIKVTAASSTN